MNVDEMMERKKEGKGVNILLRLFRDRRRRRRRRRTLMVRPWLLVCLVVILYK